MKSKRIVFTELNIPKHNSQVINKPIMNAYAIEYWDFLFNGVNGYHSLVDIEGDNIKITAGDFDLEPDETYILIIYYHGIRDYESLFPFVRGNELRKRLAEFYEDAEKCFESAAWLPFLLMCGGLFEGILISQSISDSGFANQITKARERKIITINEANIMNKVREGRNIIHASRNKENYIIRKDAMDIRKVLDKLIEKFC